MHEAVVSSPSDEDRRQIKPRPQYIDRYKRERPRVCLEEWKQTWLRIRSAVLVCTVFWLYLGSLVADYRCVSSAFCNIPRVCISRENGLRCAAVHRQSDRLQRFVSGPASSPPRKNIRRVFGFRLSAIYLWQLPLCAFVAGAFFFSLFPLFFSLWERLSAA